MFKQCPALELVKYDCMISRGNEVSWNPPHHTDTSNDGVGFERTSVWAECLDTVPVCRRAVSEEREETNLVLSYNGMFVLA